MKLTIDRISLLRPLGQVQSVVERRNTIPILANVVLQAADGALLMTATDMDMDIATQVECAVATAGTTTVSALMTSSSGAFLACTTASPFAVAVLSA